VTAEQILVSAPEGVLLRLYVQPKSRRVGAAGLHQDRLKVCVAEPPDKGKANEAVIRLVSKLFAVPRTSVRLIRGETSRQKDLLLVDSQLNDLTLRVKEILRADPLE
jgi:uncharacterized protein (TIGR00251 family)